MKSILIIFVTILILCSGCDRDVESQEVKLSCAQLQEKVIELTIKYGNWIKIPREKRVQLDKLILNGDCTILGDSRNIQFSTFKFSVKK